MILAGLLLTAVGAVDLVRQFVPGATRWIGHLAVLGLVIALGIAGDAPLETLAALATGGLWLWAMPDTGAARRTFWPAVVLGLACVLAVLGVGERADAGPLSDIWHLQSPFGPIPLDLAVLVLGVLLFLLESGNLVVRAALAGERTWHPEDGWPRPDDGADDRAGGSGFKGGRLIGPLERVLVLLLTLATAYTVLAAMLAAKGIVRFPEISKDGESGARAEYFLVGSLVSWVIALGAAFLVWWAAHL